MHLVALVLPWIATIFLAAVGIVATTFPIPLSSAYGIPIERGNPALAYVRATGMRDIALAVFLAFVLLLHRNQTAAVFCYFLMALAAFDQAVVLFALRARVADVSFADASHVERRRLAMAVTAHMGGVILFLICALLLNHLA